ncbi:hypothetical protein [Tenacibaculum sp. 190524A02b]|uniref:hypothetical protein n=1 Tax=Tenacibaculum vairaonense TaxID=3137860 RepID=UPI0032B304FF
MLFFILCLGVSILIYKVTVGFGEALLQGTKAIIKVNEEWKKKNINPIDSIKCEIIKKIDSLGLEHDTIFRNKLD